MWQLLLEPHSSLAIYSLVGNAWGKRSYSEVVAQCKHSLTFGHIKGDDFVALTQIVPIHPGSAWLMVWLAPSVRRSRKSYKLCEELWKSLSELVFDRLAVNTLLAVAASKSVAKLARRYGANETIQVWNYYGAAKDGYFIVWH